jgi:hypothetical protein
MDYTFQTLAAGTIYTISGYVKDGSEVAIEGVTMTLSGGTSATDSTTSSGYYELSASEDGNYTVTPTKTAYTFSPTSRDYNTLSADQSNQDYTATRSTFPVIDCNVSTLDFAELPLGETESMTFTITNAGLGTLTGTIADNKEWISCNATGFSITSNKIVTVTVAPTESNMNVNVEHTGTITITSNGGNKTVTVKLLPTCVIPCPNPFRLSSGKNMKFVGNGVPESTIKIYSLSGDLVKVLKEEYKNTEIEWDGINEYGSVVVPGIYLYTTVNPLERNTGRFTVIR